MCVISGYELLGSGLETLELIVGRNPSKTPVWLLTASAEEKKRRGCGGGGSESSPLKKTSWTSGRILCPCAHARRSRRRKEAVVASSSQPPSRGLGAPTRRFTKSKQTNCRANCASPRTHSHTHTRSRAHAIRSRYCGRCSNRRSVGARPRWLFTFQRAGGRKTRSERMSGRGKLFQMSLIFFFASEIDSNCSGK